MKKSTTIIVIALAVITSLILIYFINRHNDGDDYNTTNPTNPTNQANPTKPTNQTNTQVSGTTSSAATVKPKATEPQASAPTTQQRVTDPTSIKEPVDYSMIQPNESGEIPIVMFHNFIQDLNDTSDNEWTTSFNEFENLLETLYNNDFRLISMRDFIDHNISVPTGKIPMVFTFDDGTPGQYNLIEENGKLVVNPKSAVGIMLKFHEKHPDFGLKGIFYLNMSKEDRTFDGAGTLKERLDILLSYGFEVGNHSWAHLKFENLKNKAEINESLGKNQKRIEEIIEGLKFYSLALPHGSKAPENLANDMFSGEFEGVKYINETIMAVGYLPSVPSIHTDYNPGFVRRIRAQGKVEIDCDLTYWLPLMTRDRMYISDGDPDIVVVPGSKKERIKTDKLNGKKLVTY
jgi:hypothetical protein